MAHPHGESDVVAVDDDAEDPVLVAESVATQVGAFRLQPLSLHVRAGETVCLVGANGAGKTTLLRCLLGLLPADGRVRLCGATTARRDPRWLRLIGVVPDDMDELLPELSAVEHWQLVAALLSPDQHERAALLERAAALADALQFAPDPRQLVSGFSHGMRKKTQLVGALMHTPRLLVVDEPRNGLDPAGIAIMERLLHAHCAAGGAVLAASHDLHWAERIADSVAVLSGGRLVGQGPPGELTQPGEDFLEAFFRLTGTAPHLPPRA